MSESVANKKKTTGGKPHRWKKGQSGNPRGAPKRGESWAEIIAKYGNMTGGEVAQIAGYMAKEFNRLPEGVTLKELVVMRVFGQMINEPSPGLLSAFMDRTDGKVKDQQEHSGKVIITVNYSDTSAPSSGATDDQSAGETI